eukprot:365478-Chlamydomonas_euryale.AAC.13
MREAHAGVSRRWYTRRRRRRSGREAGGAGRCGRAAAWAGRSVLRAAGLGARACHPPVHCRGARDVRGGRGGRGGQGRLHERERADKSNDRVRTNHPNPAPNPPPNSRVAEGRHPARLRTGVGRPPALAPAVGRSRSTAVPSLLASAATVRLAAGGLGPAPRGRRTARAPPTQRDGSGPMPGGKKTVQTGKPSVARRGRRRGSCRPRAPARGAVAGEGLAAVPDAKLTRVAWRAAVLHNCVQQPVADTSGLGSSFPGGKPYACELVSILLCTAAATSKQPFHAGQH